MERWLFGVSTGFKGSFIQIGLTMIIVKGFYSEGIAPISAGSCKGVLASVASKRRASFINGKRRCWQELNVGINLADDGKSG